MRKLSFVVVFLFVQLNVFAQSAELEVGFWDHVFRGLKGIGPKN